MFDDDVVRKPTGHEVGMKLDGMSVEELEERLGLVRAEITRLEAAIASARATRAAADAFFKS
ncbi:DUF1192 family protein [Devosia sp.]|uniref:DUF1192 family protein n=1 Tax=Devosia sp. TaxID=1871048 RepID=UPI003A8E5727